MRHFAVAGSPHQPAPIRVRRVMLDVLLALLPGIGMHVAVFGPGVLIQITLACGFALAFEAMALRARGRPQQPFISDLSAPVTAVLFALCIPPLCPWWISAIGMLAAIGVAKHIYGGLGFNLFNPAMVGYAVVLLSFPRELSQWLAPASLLPQGVGLGDALQAILGNPAALPWDTLSSATPLDVLRNQAGQDQMINEIRHAPIFGDFGGRGWEWIANAWLLGGAYLLWRRVVHWQVPFAVLASAIALSLPFWLSDPDMHPSPLQHVFSGGLMFAAWFVATDPVTGCASPRGRLVFGAGVGVLTLVLRRWSDYPDGVAFAVLLMNALAPLIDRYTRPRVFGRGRHA